MHRVAWSLLALPALLWLAVALVAWLLGKVPAGMRIQDGVMLASYFAFFTYVAVGFITVPLLLLCIWRSWIRVWHAAAVGAITGALPLSAPAFAQLLDDRLHLHYRINQLLAAATNEFVLLGIVGGALFWFMAVWRNPHFMHTGTSAPGRRNAA